MRNNANLTEPKSLTWTGIWSLHKPNLIAWATSRCLLEHLDTDEVKAMTKDQLVEECMGAILRAEVAEEHRAAALDTVSRPIAEIIG
jgi:hypothetical protein